DGPPGNHRRAHLGSRAVRNAGRRDPRRHRRCGRGLCRAGQKAVRRRSSRGWEEGRMNWRRLHAWAAILWVVAIIVQVFLAGAALGNLGGSGDFATHRDFGYTIGIVQLIALVLAFPARMSGRDKAISAGIMILFTLSVWYAWHAWRIAGANESAKAG